VQPPGRLKEASMSGNGEKGSSLIDVHAGAHLYIEFIDIFMH
jgi:hypothetical protein